MAATSFHYKIALVLEPQPEGGFTVTSPTFPEFLTEGDTVVEVIEHARDALAAVFEIYQDQGRELPAGILTHPRQVPIPFEYAVKPA